MRFVKWTILLACFIPHLIRIAGRMQVNSCNSAIFDDRPVWVTKLFYAALLQAGQPDNHQEQEAYNNMLKQVKQLTEKDRETSSI